MKRELTPEQQIACQDSAETTFRHLANVLQWAAGNRGSKHINPYTVPEVKAALKHMAVVLGYSGRGGYLDVDTAGLSEGILKTITVTPVSSGSITE
jgi:hypothetical protein